MNVLVTVKTGMVAAKNWTVKHSPELLLGLSIGSGIAATVTGCIATKKMEDVNAKHKELIELLHERGEMDVESTNSSEATKYKDTPEYRRELTKEYGRYSIDIVKTWAPCVGLTALSATSALGSFKIVNHRLLVAETAFTGLSKFIEDYRANVVEDQGEEKDLYYANGGPLKKRAELEKAGKYKPKEKKSGDIVEPNNEEPHADVANIFHYLYCKESVKWGYYSDAPTYNCRFITSAQTIFDRKLRDEGCVDLIDVYQHLGLDTRKLYEEKAAGRTYGWALNCYTEDGMPNDQHVLFGVLEYNDTQHRLFRAGQINDVTLHFNARLLTKETFKLLSED